MNEPLAQLSLAQLREQIDEIDAKIVALVEARAVCVKKIAAIKQKQGQAYYCPEREAQVLKGVLGHKGQMPAQAMATLFRELMSACLSLEQSQAIGYPESLGVLAYAALRKHFGYAQELIACQDWQLLQALHLGRLDFALVPIKITHTDSQKMLSVLLPLGLLVFGFVVVGEVLVETPKHLPKNQAMSGKSASNSLHLVRCLILGQTMLGQSGDDKSFFWLSGAHDMDKVLAIFGTCQALLLGVRHFIEPIKPWTQAVLLEFDGHYQDKSLLSALHECQAQNIMIFCVGSCPRA